MENSEHHNIYFQHDNLLGYKIKDFIALPYQLKYMENITIQDVIQGTTWNILENLPTCAPDITNDILKVTHPLYEIYEDTRIWKIQVMEHSYSKMHMNTIVMDMQKLVRPKLFRNLTFFL